MKEEIDGIDQFERQIASLESTLNGATSLTAAFDGELKRMETSLSNTHKQVDVMSRGVSSGLRRAFDGMVFDGMKLEDALKKVSDAL
ncbi:MAG: phage tail tape measure protein, partial [Halocynthiibacter sp.]